MYAACAQAKGRWIKRSVAQHRCWRQRASAGCLWATAPTQWGAIGMDGREMCGQAPCSYVTGPASFGSNDPDAEQYAARSRQKTRCEGSRVGIRPPSKCHAIGGVGHTDAIASARPHVARRVRCVVEIGRLRQGRRIADHPAGQFMAICNIARKLGQWPFGRRLRRGDTQNERASQRAAAYRQGESAGQPADAHTTIRDTRGRQHHHGRRLLLTGQGRLSWLSRVQSAVSALPLSAAMVAQNTAVCAGRSGAGAGASVGSP